MIKSTLIGLWLAIFYFAADNLGVYTGYWGSTHGYVEIFCVGTTGAYIMYGEQSE